MNIRPANLVDIGAIAKLQVDGWQSAFKNIVPQEHLDSLNYEKQAERIRGLLAERRDRFQALVAEDDTGDIVGFTCGGPHRNEGYGFDGELWAIYVNSNSQSQGVGRQLVSAMANQLRAYGFTNMIIWCLNENPYCRFYEKLGGKIAGEKWDDIGGKKLQQRGYGWPNLQEFVDNVKKPL